MNYSLQLERLAQRDKLSVEMRAMADLVYLGYTDTDAYLVTHFDQKIYGKDYIKKKVAEAVSMSEFMRYFEKRKVSGKRVQRIAEKEDISMTDAPDKESLAKELWAVATRLPLDSKERADVMMKYADLVGFKKDVIEESDQIHFYLPLTCDKCELYVRAASRGRRLKRDFADIDSGIPDDVGDSGDDGDNEDNEDNILPQRDEYDIEE